MAPDHGTDVIRRMANQATVLPPNILAHKKPRPRGDGSPRVRAAEKSSPGLAPIFSKVECRGDFLEAGFYGRLGGGWMEHIMISFYD